MSEEQQDPRGIVTDEDWEEHNKKYLRFYDDPAREKACREWYAKCKAGIVASLKRDGKIPPSS